MRPMAASTDRSTKNLCLFLSMDAAKDFLFAYAGECKEFYTSVIWQMFNPFNFA